MTVLSSISAIRLLPVAAVHIQIESSLFDYGRNDAGSIEEEVFTYGAMNVKFGILNNVDLQPGDRRWI